MRLTANDTLHVSSVKADNIAPGEEFEVSDDVGQQLVDRRLATKGTAKAASTHKNKMEPAPANKAAKAPISAAGAKPARKSKAT